MRTKRTIATLGESVRTRLALRGVRARAEDEPPRRIRRAGQWDSFLDPVRDFEDEYVTGAQKTIEDATGIHVGGRDPEGLDVRLQPPRRRERRWGTTRSSHSSPSLDAAQRWLRTAG